MEQLTQEQARAFASAEKWRDMTTPERAAFQLAQRRLCMPFGVFHEAVEATLGRPVCTHEFGLNVEGLIAELEGKAVAPTFEQILAMLPIERTVVVVQP